MGKHWNNLPVMDHAIPEHYDHTFFVLPWAALSSTAVFNLMTASFPSMPLTGGRDTLAEPFGPIKTGMTFSLTTALFQIKPSIVFNPPIVRWAFLPWSVRWQWSTATTH